MPAPIAEATAETLPFWEAAARGELLYQRCRRCGKVQFYPRGHCAACAHRALDFEPSAGHGTIYSFTIVHRAPSAAFRDLVPYVIALVDMAEGFRLMVNLLGSDAVSGAAIGRPVRIVFAKRGEGQAVLPQAELVA